MKITRDDALTKIIYAALLEKGKLEAAGKKVTSIHAGKIGECPRKIAFLMYNLHDESVDPVGMVHMQMGIKWHEFIQGIFTGSGKITIIEEKQEKLWGIAGMMDAVIKERGKLIPIEIKPLSAARFMKMSEPDANHVGQLMMYMHWKKAPYGRIIYYNKNISHWRADTFKRMPFIEFVVKYDKKLMATFKQKAEVITDALAKRELPNIPQEFGKKFCAYCPFYPVKCVSGMKYVTLRLKELENAK